MGWDFGEEGFEKNLIGYRTNEAGCGFCGKGESETGVSDEPLFLVHHDWMTQKKKTMLNSEWLLMARLPRVNHL